MKHLIVTALCLAVSSSVWSGDFTANVTNTKSEPVADAVISLIPLDQPAPAVDPQAVVEISQQDQEFRPFVTVIQAGTRVALPNRDGVQHHVYSLSKPKKFELPLYNPGQAESLVFDIAGLVTLGCNIHDWMVSHLVIVPTPWFGKTDADGKIRITAPAGRYRLELWHPRLATTTTKEVLLTDSAASEDFKLTLKPDRRIRRAPAGKTGGY